MKKEARTYLESNNQYMTALMANAAEHIELKGAARKTAIAKISEQVADDLTDQKSDLGKKFKPTLDELNKKHSANLDDASLRKVVVTALQQLIEELSKSEDAAAAQLQTVWDKVEVSF